LSTSLWLVPEETDSSAFGNFCFSLCMIPGDGASWKNGYPIPGRTNYPLLFDRDRRPKPAFDAVLAVPARTR
jgi:hypothetical protein